MQQVGNLDLPYRAYTTTRRNSLFAGPATAPMRLEGVGLVVQAAWIAHSGV